MSDTNVPANISVTARDHEVTEALLHESDRGCVLLGAALLDEALEETLRAAFRNDAAARRDVQSLFKAAYAPLRSFAVKAQLAFALGLISRRVFDRITIIRQLRNAFAHSHGHLDFQSPSIKDQLDVMIGAAGAPREEDEQFIELPKMKVRRGHLTARLAFALCVSRTEGGIKFGEELQAKYNLSFAKIVLQDWTMGQRRASHGPQCPSHSLCWAPCARRSETAPTSRSRIWRSDSSSPYSAADRSDPNSGTSIAPSGCGSPTGGLDGARRSTSYAPRP
jgi:DNA-binding MltR family transcriptional regulator